MSAIPLRRVEGKYEILEKLGEGGMSAVYKVRHQLLDDVRVIKIMRPEFVAAEEFKVWFQQVAKFAIRLKHPNIAHHIDFAIDEEDGTAFIVREFIEGVTLEEMLCNTGPPPLGLALEIAQQSLCALTHLHEKEFVHGDISPDSFILTEDENEQPLIKLLDLGTGKVLGGSFKDLSDGGEFYMGSIRYSPPEQFSPGGADRVGIRGDLYSFGIVLYELLTGRYPVQGGDMASIMAGHLFRPPLSFAESDPGGRVPPALRALVLRALAKEPEQRFASAREFGKALAVLRTPGDISGGDLRPPLPPLPGGTVLVGNPVNTQGLLPLLDPGSTSLRTIEHAVARIERCLQHGDLLAAETGLRWAIEIFGEQPKLVELRTHLQQGPSPLQSAMLPEVSDEEIARHQAERNAAARDELVSEFGFVDLDEDQLTGWQGQGRIFPVEHQGRLRFPAFQFNAEGQPLPVIAQVLSTLGRQSTGWELALWFTSSEGWLDGRRPVDLLLNEPEEVAEAAEREAEGLFF